MGVAVPDGREAVLERLVRGCAARDQPGADPEDLPIIVLWGSRGSECSQLLRHLEEIDDWSGPRAYLDGEALPAELRPHEIANRLAFQLGRRVAGFGRARFPRFFLGMWAVGDPLDPDSLAGAKEARRATVARKLRNRSEWRKWVRDAAVALGGLAGMDAPVTSAVGLAVDGVIEVSRTIALLRGPGMRWYREGLGRHFADPVDGLVELSVREFQEDQEWVDEVLCRAFLEDLRAEFGDGFRLFAKETNAVALLDNVGTPELSGFLTVISEQPSGSLLTVAASHQRYPSAAAAKPTEWQPDALEEASIARWQQERPRRGGSRYYTVWVDPVDDVAPTEGPTRREVRTIADREHVDPPLFPTVAFAHRLTAAHPTGLGMILSALRDQEGNLVPGFDLRGTLGLEDPEGQGLDQKVLDLVLGPWTEDMRRGLVLMAVAVDLSNAKIAPILREEAAPGRKLITEFRARDLWVIHQVEDGQAQPPRLHPFARRAIAHRLARPGGIASPDQASELRWDHAHELLRNSAVAGKDEMAALYHGLALGRLPDVATRFTELFDPVHPQRWYEQLLQVTQAPLAHPDRAESTRAHFGELVTDNAPEPLVSTRLLAALQLHTDPLADPHHDMCGIVENELDKLAGHAAEGAAFLIEQSKTFHQCWNRWHPRGGDRG